MFRLLILFCALWITSALFSQTDSIAVQKIDEVKVLGKPVISDSITVHKLDEIWVVATPTPAGAIPPSPFNVMTAGDISRLGVQSMADAVRRFPGVVVKDYGGVGGFKSVSLRGNGAEYTTVLYDGVAVSNAQTGQIDISKYSLDNVTVLSLTIGQSNDIFRPAKAFSSIGTLAIQSNKPNFTWNKNYEGQIILKTGSWGYFTPYASFSQKINNKFYFSLDGLWVRSDGQYSYERKNGSSIEKSKRRNSDVNTYRAELNLFGKLSVSEDLSIKLYYYDSERGIPGAFILYNPDKSAQRMWDKDIFVQSSYTNMLNDKLKFQLNGKYSFYRNRFVDYDAPASAHTKFIQNEYYFSGVAMYSFSKSLSVSLSEDVSANYMPQNASIAAKADRYTSQTALSGKFQKKRLDVVGTLLTTLISNENNTQYKKQHMSPSLSFSYRLLNATNLRLRASYKDVFRAPNFNELYYKQVGNTALRAEKSQQYNMGLTWSTDFSPFFDYFRITGDVYYNNVTDKIITYFSVPHSRVLNAGKVDIKGFDVDMYAHFKLNAQIGVRLAGNYTYQKAIDVSDAEDKNYKHQIPFTPEHSGSVSCSLENPWVNVSYSLIASGDTYNKPQNIELNKIESFVEHTASVNRSVCFGECEIMIQAEITNITNKTYYIVKDYPMPGRAFRLTLNMKF